MLHAVLLLALAPTQAAQPCPAASDLPRELAGWTAPVAVRTGAARATVLPVGRAARADLLPTLAVRFPVAPAKPAAEGTHAGLFAFEVPRPGRYRVAVSDRAWLEVARDSRSVPSAVHGHGPACSGIAKMVDFDLNRGRYLLEVTGASAPTVTLMVAKLS